MRALWLEDRRLSVRGDAPVPEPPPGEALVRVLRAGICNTDIELMHGYYPFTGIPGHEFGGVVEQGPAALLGRRVVGEINAVCGSCGACLAGRRTHCERRTVLGIVRRHGAFADYLILPAENLHPIPDAVSTDAGVFTEPLAAALEIQEQVPIGSGDRVLALRAVRSRAPAPRGETGRRRAHDPRALPARRGAYGVRPRPTARRAESAAGHRLGRARR